MTDPESPPIPEKVPHDGAKATLGYTGVDHPREDIFFAAVQTTRMPMIVTDPHRPDNPIVFANQAFVSMTGYDEEEIIGQNCRFLQGKGTDRTTLAEIRQAIATRTEIATEILNYRKDGSSFWNALFISPVYDKQGQLIYFFASQLDVSRRRDAEDALRQAQKMEALGQLTGGIAHDFNNLLQVINGYQDLLAHELDKDDFSLDRARRHIGIAQDAVTRATKLTQQLLAFSRKQKLYGRLVNLNELVQGMRDLLARALGDDVELALELGEEAGNARVDPTQFEVALLNIIINARDAMEGRDTRRVTIGSRAVTVDSQLEDAPGELRHGRYVVVSIEDTGAGMPQAVLEHVLDPFFTTKEEGKGTGLGLSMVYGFVRQSGGAMTIHSTEGRGAQVRLYFPVVEGHEHLPAGARKAFLAGARGRADARLLLVEDRPDVAILAQELLEDMGYTVAVASHAKEALTLVAQGFRPDLLFTDLIMPGNMNGVMLARELRSILPRLKVLLTTGYSDASLERTDAGGEAFEMLEKPYSRDDLERRVRQVLEGPTGVS